MNSFTSSTRNRRCPPGVLTDFNSPRLAHKRTVTGATSSRSATWCGVRYSSRRPRGDGSACWARRTLPVDLCEFILLTYSAEKTALFTGIRPANDRSTIDRMNASMAILALQAYIAYFGTSSPVGSHRVRYAVERRIGCHLQSRHREGRWR